MEIRASVKFRNNKMIAAREAIPTLKEGVIRSDLQGCGQVEAAERAGVPAELLRDLERLNYSRFLLPPNEGRHRWTKKGCLRDRVQRGIDERIQQAQQLAEWLGLQEDEVLPSRFLGIRFETDRSAVAYVPPEKLVDMRPVESRLLLPMHQEETVRDALDRAMRSLTYREKEILRMRYGLDGTEVHTFEEVSQVMKVSRERIRQIEVKAIDKAAHAVRVEEEAQP